MTGLNSSGMGWFRDNPDFRDYTLTHPSIEGVLNKNASKISGLSIPQRVDLRDHFFAIRDQGSLNAASAFAGVALHEYFSARMSDSCSEGSALFVFKMAQTLQGSGENIGVGLRNVLKAIRRFGLPDEEFYPSSAENLRKEPSGFLFSFRPCPSDRSPWYVRLDARNNDGLTTLKRVKRFLASGFPCVCGFPVPKSVDASGEISLRSTSDGIRGGYAVVVAGYDDEHLPDHSGALLVRSSWGTAWGEKGYGWLPYAFVIDELAVDFWTLLREDWLRPQGFELGEV